MTYQLAMAGEMYCQDTDPPRTISFTLGRTPQNFMAHAAISSLLFSGSGTIKVHCIDIDGVNPGGYGQTMMGNLNIAVITGTAKRFTYRVKLPQAGSAAAVGFMVFLA